MNRLFVSGITLTKESSVWIAALGINGAVILAKSNKHSYITFKSFLISFQYVTVKFNNISKPFCTKPDLPDLTMDIKIGDIKRHESFVNILFNIARSNNGNSKFKYNDKYSDNKIRFSCTSHSPFINKLISNSTGLILKLKWDKDFNINNNYENLNY